MGGGESICGGAAPSRARCRCRPATAARTSRCRPIVSTSSAAIRARWPSGSAIALKPGEKRAGHGSVAGLCAEYLGSLDFLGRPKSVRDKHRKHVEDFRVRRGDRMASGLDQEAFEKRLAAMLDTPASANQWLVAMRDLMAYAVKRKLVAS